jgi:hypothetical protein
MEIIRIPQVSLVDATGKRIGVYTDDPDWWQQLKLKHQSHQINMNSSMIGGRSGSNAIGLINYLQDETQKRPWPNKTSLAISVPPALQHSQTKLNENDNVSLSSRSKLINGKESPLDKKLGQQDQQNKQQVSTVSTISHSTSFANQGIRTSVAATYEENQRQCNVIGETPLHIAIMYDDFNSIKYLIETKGLDVNQRTVGGKFVGGFNSKLTFNLIQQSKYESLAYYGEYPLAFAACFASKEIYDYLIEKGADPNLKGSQLKFLYEHMFVIRIRNFIIIF